MIDFNHQAIVAFAEAKPVYSVFHDGAEYWVVVDDRGVYRTCNGIPVFLSPQERRLQPHPVRVNVRCSDNRLDAHALHPSSSPKPHRTI